MKIKSLVRKNIAALAPYSTARDEYSGGELGVFLDANENPYDNGYNRYPDPHQLRLKSVISKIKNVDTKNIFIGNGSDEPIDLVYRIFCEPGVHNIVSIAPTYGMYRVCADINNVEMREVPLTEDFGLDCKGLLDACDKNTRMMFLCSPNNPTGNLLDADQMVYLICNFDGIVVIDEAYIDFSSCNGFVPHLEQFPNVIVLQTLSKAWGMAGLRLGLAFASEYIVGLMSKVKYPYNINVVTQKLVEERLGVCVEGSIKEIISQRGLVVDQLSQIEIVRHIYHSDSNFLLVRFDEPKKVYDVLVESGIIVRDRSKVKGCEGCLRITIGTPEENEKLINIIKGL